MTRWRDLRIIPALDRSATMVRLAQTRLGRAAMVLVYGVLVLGGGWKNLFIALAIIPPIVFPAHRRKLVALTSIVVLGVGPTGAFLERLSAGARLGAPASKLLQVAVTLAVLAACAASLRAARARPGSAFWRRPVEVVLSLFVVSLAAASVLPLRDGLTRLLVWAALAAFGKYLWYFCYSLKDRAPRGPSALAVEVGHYQPVWWGGADWSVTPIPKAGSFLDRIEAKTPEALAVCQLKGLKLVMWAVALAVTKSALLALAYGKPFIGAHFVTLPHLGIPTFHEAFSASAGRAPLSCGITWASLLTHFFVERMLASAAAFHLAVSACRMFGFYALRAMYRPFEARSFADFWNRFHFYFKELLVELFFYPTFVRYFRGRPALRLFAATFAAACVGNFYFHFTQDFATMAFEGFTATIVKWRTYALYSLLLALGICLSQVFGRRSRPASTRLGRVGTTAFVLGCYCLLGVIDDAVGQSFGACGRFFLTLAGNP